MRLTRRGFWGSSLAALGAAVERKPNIVLILADDLGWRYRLLQPGVKN